MMAAVKVLGTVLTILMPGGLVVAVALVLARVVSDQMQKEQGTHGQRLIRAFAAVQLKDVLRKTRELV
jgi:hypothetical protein